MTRREHVLEEVVERLTAARSGHPLRVAVDGITAAGKTTFANDLAAALRERGVPVVRVTLDGFHRPRAQRHRQGRDSADGYYEDAYDFAAVARVLLEPLGRNEPYRDAVLDLATDTPVEPPWQTAPSDAVVVVDGSFLQRDLAHLWDEVVFLQADPDVARARGVRRDHERLGGREAADALFRSRYHAACARYLSEVDPARKATVLLDIDDLTTDQGRRGPTGGRVRPEAR